MTRAAEELRNLLTGAPGVRRLSATKDEVRATLLAGQTMTVWGTLYQIKAKHLAAGIYEMWLEQWEPPREQAKRRIVRAEPVEGEKQ